MKDHRSPLAIARDQFLEYAGKWSWLDPVPPKYIRNRLEAAWLHGACYCDRASQLQPRAKVASPGWLRGKVQV